MKKFVVIIVVLAAIVAAVALYLKSTTPTAGAGIRFPLTPDQRDLLASVPASAESFALIPTAAAVRHKLFENPITRPLLLQYAEDHAVPRSWMMGGGDLVVWRAGKETSYSARLDPLRAALVRFYLMFASSVDARADSGRFLINAGSSEPLGPQRLDELLAVANGIGPADAVIIEQANARGGFPPIGKPSVTAVQIGRDDINITSVAPWRDAGPPASSAVPRFARGALLSAAFHGRPRIVGDLDRVLMTRLSHLLDNGGAVVLYDVNAGTLLPRPDGLAIAAATPDNLNTVHQIEDTVKMFGDVKQTGDQIFISFDKDSMRKYESESFVDAPWPSNDWALRLDARRAGTILDKLSGNTGLRIAAPRIYRSARQLDDWVMWLGNASSVEASHSAEPQREVLRVRMASK